MSPLITALLLSRISHVKLKPKFASPVKVPSMSPVGRTPLGTGSSICPPPVARQAPSMSNVAKASRATKTRRKIPRRVDLFTIDSCMLNTLPFRMLSSSLLGPDPRVIEEIGHRELTLNRRYGGRGLPRRVQVQ